MAVEAMDVESGSFRRGSFAMEGFAHVKSSRRMVIGCAGSMVVLIGVCIVLIATRDWNGRNSDDATVGGIEVEAPWWIVKGIAPEGPRKSMGTWEASTFSTEQQKKYGVDETGKVVDQTKFDAAMAAIKASPTSKQTNQARPPWWITAKVTPKGPEKDMGTWKAVTFDADQQKHYGVDGFGRVVDQKVFDAAMGGGTNIGVVPPWWILHNVTPEGPDKDMGGWTAITFSEAQKAQFGVDDTGAIVDQSKFDAAIVALEKKQRCDECKAQNKAYIACKPDCSGLAMQVVARV